MIKNIVKRMHYNVENWISLRHKTPNKIYFSPVSPKKRKTIYLHYYNESRVPIRELDRHQFYARYC